MTIEEKEKLLKISRNTVIHCETSELSIEVCNIFKSLGLEWVSGDSYNTTKWLEEKHNTCYNPIYGGYSSLNCYVNYKYNIISAQEFISLHSKPITNKKVYYKGDPERGAEIIDALTKLGGDPGCHDGSESDALYYIGQDGNIWCYVNFDCNTLWLLHQAGFTEAFLPEIEIVEINGKKYELTNDLKKLIETLKEVE